MKTIGILGGMSWQSTATYYRLLNEGAARALGDLHSAPIRLHSFDFAAIAQAQRADDWSGLANTLTRAAQGLERAGAELLLIATNTMHKVADEVQAGVRIPLLHIGDALADALLADGVCQAGLLGTRFTMEQDFLKKRLQARGIEVHVPNEKARQQVHEVIFDELCQGHCLPHSRQAYLRIMQDLARQGAEAIILGCTEIALLVQPQHTPLPLYDTTALHCKAALKQALEPQQH